jgi:hypothetical protein
LSETYFTNFLDEKKIYGVADLFLKGRNPNVNEGAV